MTRARCPICKAPAVHRYRGGDPEAGLDPVFPFCSRRCQLVDLGRWLDGDYRVEDDPVEGYDSGPRSSDRDS